MSLNGKYCSLNFKFIPQLISLKTNDNDKFKTFLRIFVSFLDFSTVTHDRYCGGQLSYKHGDTVKMDTINYT